MRSGQLILMIIDVFSKFGRAIPLKTKTGLEVSKAFHDLWKTQSPPQKLWTDKGKEFYNRTMRDLLKKRPMRELLKKKNIYYTQHKMKKSRV